MFNKATFRVALLFVTIFRKAAKIRCNMILGGALC